MGSFVECLLVWVSWMFFHNYTGVLCFWKEDHRGVHWHQTMLGPHVISDVNFQHPARVVFARFLPVNVLSHPFAL